MAQISPYGDPNAHGPLHRSLCFRRYKNKVSLQAFPNPVARNTAAIINQRQKLTDAALAYSLLPKASLDFYRKRSSQKQMTSRNLFMSADMKKYLPSILRPIPAKSIEDMVIFDPAGLYSDEIKISIFSDLTPGATDLEKSCIGWGKLEDQLTEIGPNFLKTGDPTYHSGKFNNGARLDAVSENLYFVCLPAHDFSQGIWGCWIKPEGWSIENGVCSDAGNHILFSFRLDANNRMDLYSNASGFIWESAHGGTRFDWTSTAEGFDVPADQWTWIAFTWERTHGTKKRRIYIGENEIDSDNQSWNPVVMANAQFTLGTAIAGAYSFEGMFDNFKWYDDPDVIAEAIANRNNEGFPLSLVEYGNIFDFANVYVKVDEVAAPAIQKIIITTPSGHPAHIPFRYLVRVEWKDDQDEIFNSVIRLPELIMGASESIELFLSKDWSVYWDKDFHRIACTNQL